MGDKTLSAYFRPCSLSTAVKGLSCTVIKCSQNNPKSHHAQITNEFKWGNHAKKMQLLKHKTTVCLQIAGFKNPGYILTFFQSQSDNKTPLAAQNS